MNIKGNKHIYYNIMSISIINTENTINTKIIESTMDTDNIEDTVIGTGNSCVIGCVKFFDKTAGFGFINVLKNIEFAQFSEKDIFVHYSGIHIENQQYKYLVKGEYVEFKIVPSTKPNGSIINENEKYNAVNITGIQCGKLMCETNYNEYIPKTNKQSTNSTTTQRNYGRNESTTDIDFVSIPTIIKKTPYNNNIIPSFTRLPNYKQFSKTHYDEQTSKTHYDELLGKKYYDEQIIKTHYDEPLGRKSYNEQTNKMSYIQRVPLSKKNTQIIGREQLRKYNV